MNQVILTPEHGTPTNLMDTIDNLATNPATTTVNATFPTNVPATLLEALALQHLQYKPLGIYGPKACNESQHQLADLRRSRELNHSPS